MAAPNESPAVRHFRADSVREEQALCNHAIESGDYDTMSDQEWVALCESLSNETRHAAEIAVADED